MQSYIESDKGKQFTAELRLQVPYFSTTLDYREWEETPNLIVKRPPNQRLFDELKTVYAVFREALRSQTLLLDSSSGRIYPDVLACALLGLLPRSQRAAIALFGDMWQPNPGLRGAIERFVIRMADRAIDRYIVLSSEELEVFPRLWQIDPCKMRLQVFFYSFSEQDLNEPVPPQGTHIFAGGNGNRDYRPLVEAARLLPEYKFVLATRRLEQIIDPPPNLTAGPVSHPEFVRLMRSAAAVVVPMRRDLQRSAGQQTYLNAMYLKKPTIVNQVFGVNNHITNQENALVVDGSAESYVNTIRWVFDAANETAVKTMTENAHQTVRDQFSVQHFVNGLQALMQEFALENPNRRS